MSNMEEGVQAFRAELKRLGAEKIGLYIGAYFMLEQEVSTKNFDAVWIPAYGADSGYYEALPNTEIDYDLHQYTSQGSLPGFDNILDLNQINLRKTNVKPLKNSLERLRKKQLKIRRLLRQIHQVVSKNQCFRHWFYSCPNWLRRVWTNVL